MSFLADDEHIVIVDYAAYWGNGLTHDELCRLREAGVRTMMGYLLWERCEPARGVYDWTQADAIVAQARAAGLKLLLQVYDYAPGWAPEDWYLRGVDGRIHNQPWRGMGPDGDVAGYSIFSPWHPEAWACHLAFTRLARERYDAGDVLCINGGPVHGGEMLLPQSVPSFFDDNAIADYQRATGRAGLPDPNCEDGATRDWLGNALVRIYLEQFGLLAGRGEYWTAFHRAFHLWPYSGAYAMDALYGVLHQQLPGEHWGFCFTVFRPGVQAPQGAQHDVQRYGIRMLVGSEGCAGLRSNTGEAIRRGYRGFVTGPLCPYLSYSRMEDWMYDAVRDSLAEWRRA